MREDLRELLRLALPVVIVQVGMMTMGVVDTIMVGHVSALALGAVALGNLYFFGLAVFGMGTLMALDPLVAQAVGARDETSVALGLQRGLRLSALLSIPSSLLLLTAGPILRLFGQPAELVPEAAGYALRVLPGVFPFFAFTVLRQTLQAMHRLRAIVLTIVLANVLNAFLNWIFVFGRLGLPPMGAFGSAWATSISRWLMAAGLLALAWPALRPYLRPRLPEAGIGAPLWRMFLLGAPIGVQYQLELGAFAAVALMMGMLGTIEVAAHQVAINLASLTFMVPMGLAAAAAVLVGNAVGRGDPAAARRAARASLVCGAAFMAAAGFAFLTIPGALAGVYTGDAAVLRLAAVLLPIAGVFQVFDGLQVVSGGILRGLGDTRTPMVVNILGFWLLGLPASVVLGFYTPLAARGLWWGFVVGLGSVAVILLVMVRLRLRGQLSRVTVDAPPPVAGAESSAA